MHESSEKAFVASLPVPINDLKRHFTSIRDDLLAAVTKTLESGWYVLGKEVADFERSFSEYCGVRHCVSVASGTDALALGLRALGVGPGAHVATVANAGFYTVTALHMIGATPVFVDVDDATHLMSIDDLATVIAHRKVDAIVVTHLYGRMHDVERIRTLADRAGILVLEDCAQAHGARRANKRAGSVGHAGAFSFYPTKNLGALGDGGAVVTNDDAIAERLRLLRQYGWESKYKVVTKGGTNSRLDEVQAAVLNVKLPHLDGWNARRRQIASRYSAEIRRPGVLCPPPGDDAYVGHLYVVQCSDRDGLARHLKANGIGCDIHYPIPDHQQPCLIGTAVSLPVTERLAATILTLPCHPDLTDDEVGRVIDVVNSW